MECMSIGHDIDSCTSQICPIRIDTSQFVLDFPWLKGRGLIVVDTPGFNDTRQDDNETIKKIANWLKRK